MIAKQFLIKLHQVLASQLGIDPQRFIKSIRGSPSFLRDLLEFRKSFTGTLKLMPCLQDRHEEGGTTKSEYFWQDLLVARWIYEARPERHVDVGSRIDGFVAHVASFRLIEVIDVRPVTMEIPGVVFKQVDITQQDAASGLWCDSYCDSLSCLHALEHFGLGRYGDAIDSRGHERGIANMAVLLRSGGTLYLSTPIGRERVEFNANRVFDPRTIVSLARANGLQLSQLTVIGGHGEARQIEMGGDALRKLSEVHYNLGLFIFTKQ